MKTPAIKKIHHLFTVIAGVAAAAAIFAVASSLKLLYPDFAKLSLAFFMIIAPLAIEALGAAGLIVHWFDRWTLRPGRVINILQWIAGFLGVAGIFDIVMRITRRAEWMVSGALPFAVDATLILLFVLWLMVSYYIDKDVKERKVCQFC